MGLSACGFSGSPGEGAVDGPQGDGAGSGDGAPGCKLFVDLCNETAGTQELRVTGNVKIDTDRDNRCRVKNQTGGPAICALFFSRVEIESGATLTFHGNRAVALSARDEILVDGTLDVAARRNAPMGEPAAGSLMSCTYERAPDLDPGGGGGGAGGSYATKGGEGGEGDTDDNGEGPGGDDETGLGGKPPAVAVLAGLRGGCPGQTGGNNSGTRGRGGRGGGAIYLAAPDLRVSGLMSVAAAGGTGGSTDAQGGGGGGGGSGGLIVMEGAAVRIESTAIILATGGGGGQGGISTSLGEDGGDATTTTVAPGGDTPGFGGNGGTGSVSGDGAAGAPNNGGAGGGGGGVGYLRIISKNVTRNGGQFFPDLVVVNQ